VARLSHRVTLECYAVSEDPRPSYVSGARLFGNLTAACRTWFRSKIYEDRGRTGVMSAPLKGVWRVGIRSVRLQTA
jgi:hypothetical protein